jgi:hypothetical protein
MKYMVLFNVMSISGNIISCIELAGRISTDVIPKQVQNIENSLKCGVSVIHPTTNSDGQYILQSSLQNFYSYIWSKLKIKNILFCNSKEIT